MVDSFISLSLINMIKNVCSPEDFTVTVLLLGYNFNSLPTKCSLVITFANSFDPDQARHYSLYPDQARHNVVPDLGPNCLTLSFLYILPDPLASIIGRCTLLLLKDFFEKVDFEKKSADDNKSMKITQHAKNLYMKLQIQCRIYIPSTFMCTYSSLFAIVDT